MSSGLATSVGYAAIGGVSVTAGAAYATSRALGATARSLVQHAAAGTVFAGLVIDVLAKLERRSDQLLFTVLGLLVGLAGMLAVRRWAPEEPQGGRRGAGSLVVTVLTDVLVDGVLIGLSAALGPGTGLLFALALAPEMFLLGTTAATRLDWPRSRTVTAAAVTGAGIVAGGALGWAVARAPAGLATGVLGAGASVIMYLVFEELLREAHEQDTGPVEVAVLFAGFLPFFCLGIAVG
ncbi:hypothetical protein [Streptomyces sediminimaris]|uniref:hypothetical protein n=1 Tax=Streptomyces sediminimaris TaxID=3383721 RepID=UPI00399B9960